ncbi:Porphobilinogen deaminase [hydrothermal vent metagenome]|uniref:hydroxymethylbilane synthase n=1 Tax=hydrothermal vent metagenome TaxID=652676 RepID=A0A3B0TZU0_9ZZZZ
MNNIVRIGTRGSKLALYQAYRVQSELEDQFPDKTFEIVIIKTKGDKILDVPLSKIGDKGLFTKELEIALFNNEIDMAVHSLKDLPTIFPDGAKLGAVLKRGNVSDALVSLDNRKLKNLTPDDIIATSSLRRKAQLLKINKDFKIVEIRGNVNTRIRKMQEGYCNVMIMAAAGLQRLGMGEYITEVIDPETMIPACSQGAIAIEVRENDPFIEEVISKINHKETYITTQAERAFLRTLEGGCQIPVGSFSKISGNKFHITGFISSIDGSKFLRDSSSGNINDAVQISTGLANSLNNRGGKEILESIRNINLSVAESNLPLKNRIIISTRAKESTDSLPGILTKEGARVFSFPMIEITSPVLGDVEIRYLKNIGRYNWIFFTSKNGVSHFFKQLIEVGGSTELPGSLKIAVIGEKTSAELDYYGYAPDFISTGNTSSAGLLDSFYEKYNPKNLKILLALGNLADNTLFNRLSDENIVDRVNVYNTIKPGKVDSGILNIIKNDKYDLILFTSPSTFYNFSSYFTKDEMQNMKIASIGQTTTNAISNSGFEPLFTAKKPNIEGLKEAIIEYYNY